jgi:DNA-directed RNA polymerase specialized sigma24 family protein
VSEDGTRDRNQLADQSLSAEEHLHFAERDSHIDMAIQKLPALLRLPLELHLSEGASMVDLATSLGISVPAGKSRLLRARARVGQVVLKRYIFSPEGRCSDAEVAHRQTD